METAATRSRPLTDAGVPEAVDAPSAARRLAGVLPGLVALGIVAGLGVKHGGYFATAWGPMTLVFLGVAAAVLIVHPRPNVTTRGFVLPGLLALLILWILASSAWGSPSEAVPEAQRALLYVSAALALALVLRRGATVGVLIGIWLGIAAVSLDALGTRLLPEQLAVFDPIAGYRLSEPVGYWNALGLLAALGALLALGLAARAELLVVRLLAGASTVPLALTLYFTFSRGGWIALVVGLLSALALDPRRVQLAVHLGALFPWAALVVLIASTSGPLTESGRYTLDAAAADGRELIAAAVGLALFAAGAVALVAAFEPRFRLGPGARRIGDGVVLGGIVVLVTASVLALGGPSEIARSFAGPTAPIDELNDRLFTLSGSGRVDQWRIALDDASEHPFVGSGAGSYKRYWLAHRPEAVAVRDAHSLYLEMLAELGPVGLALVLAIFGMPLVLAVRLRHRPVVPIAAAALVAYLAHAGIDWDWEFPILTLIALACASVIVAEGSDGVSERARRHRVGLLAAIAVVVPLVAVATLENRAEAAAAEAFDERAFERSAKEAETAERLAPWSVEPLVLLGRAQSAAGNGAAARATFRRVVAREPDHWRAWFELAAVSTGSARDVALRRARALNPLENVEDLEEGP